jgi:hypothetical protein
MGWEGDNAEKGLTAEYTEYAEEGLCPGWLK